VACYQRLVVLVKTGDAGACLLYIVDFDVYGCCTVFGGCGDKRGGCRRDSGGRRRTSVVALVTVWVALNVPS